MNELTLSLVEEATAAERGDLATANTAAIRANHRPLKCEHTVLDFETDLTADNLRILCAKIPLRVLKLPINHNPRPIRSFRIWKQSN
jgi:hypothetical protein